MTTKAYFGRHMGQYTVTEASVTGIGYSVALIGAVWALTAGPGYREGGWILIAIGVVVGLFVVIARGRRLRRDAT